MKVWLPRNVRVAIKEFNKESEKRYMEKKEDMRENSRFDYDIDAVGFNPNLFSKKRKTHPERNHKVICSKCGKEFIGYLNQVKAEKPLCSGCIEKKTLNLLDALYVAENLKLSILTILKTNLKFAVFVIETVKEELKTLCLKGFALIAMAE